MGDEGPAYAVPDAVLFRNWGQLGQSNTRTLLLKNNSDEARQLYISYPFSTIFAIGIAGDGWTYNNAPAWAATIVPPRSAVKVTVTLKIPSPAPPSIENYQDALVVVVGACLIFVPLRAVKQSLDPLGGAALRAKLEELAFTPAAKDLDAACAKYLELFQERTGLKAYPGGVAPPPPPPTEEESRAAEEAARAAARQAEEAAAAAARLEAAQRRRELLPPEDFSTPAVEEEPDFGPVVMESKPLRTAGRTVFVAALPTEDTLKRLVAAASSSSSSPAYSSSTAPAVATAARGLGPGEASGGGGDRPVSSAGKGLFLINGRWFNARGEPVEPPGSSRSDNVNATRGGRASSAGAGGGGSGPDSVGAKDVDPLRSAALEAAMKELGLSDLPVPPHVATARKAAAAAQGSGGGQGLGSGAGQDAASIGFKAAAAVALRFQSQGAVYDYAGRQAVDDYEDSEIEEMLEARLDEEVLGLPPRPAKRKPQLQGTVTSSGRSGGAAAAAAASGSATSRSGASQAGSNTQRGSPLMGTAQGAAAAGAGRKVAAAGSRSLSLTGRLSDGNSTSRLSSRGSATAAGGGAASNASVSPEKQKKNWDDLT